MTTQQPDALRLADELCEAIAEYPEPTALEAQAAAELLRQHVENETLRAGYAAARLEVESLKAQLVERAKEHADELTVAYMCGASREKELAAQQPGAAYAEMPISSHAGRVYEEGFLVGTCPLYNADKMRAFADATHALRASHGLAPAQAVPAAVAGPSGYGPNVTVRRSCSDCKACNSESYAVQGDSGHYVYCEHPSLPESKYIGDTNWNTPHWCPVSAPTTQPAPAAEWQDISTAPKDGRTLLLGYFNSAGNWRTLRGRWVSEDYISAFWKEPENGEPGWYECAVEADNEPNCWATDPTHWMPLPSPPARKG